VRRLAVILPLLAPLPAGAQATDAFCAGLLQLVAGAAQGFAEMPRTGGVLHGSIEERRGVTSTDDGPPRAVYYAVMLRDDARRRPNPADGHFRRLQAEIARCLPQAQPSALTPGQGGARITWTTEQALVGLRLDDGGGDAGNAEVEVSVASRW
jgi:hypothetical protein